MLAHADLRDLHLPTDAHATLGDEVHVWLAGGAPASPLQPAGGRLLRQALAHYTGLAAGELVICEDGGKPQLEHPVWGERLQFNLDQAGPVVACAVAAGGRDVKVGVALVEGETRRDPGFDWEAAARRACSAQESSRIARLPPAKQRGEFFAYWALKQAFVKARGPAEAVPLDGVVFDLGFRAPALLAPQSLGTRISSAFTFALRRRDDVTLALAIEAPRGRRFTCRMCAREPIAHAP
jgi:hypothetical protein